MTPRDATPGRTPTGSTPRPGGLRARTGHRIQQGAAPQPSQVADNGGMAGTEKPAGGRRRARELNELIRYTMWSVFRVRNATALDAGRADRAALAGELEGLLDQAAGKGVTTRGCYDVQGLRADADYMFWWIAPSPDDLQELYARFREMRISRSSQSSDGRTTPLPNAHQPRRSRSGRTLTRCTGRPSSTRGTSQRSSPASRRVPT